MAGTRLIIHTTFVVELVLLIVASFLYASNKPHDPFSSAEPFLADQSGWKILTEDATPAPSPQDDGRGLLDEFSEYVGDVANVIMSQINSLRGVVEQEVVVDKSRRSSKFVQEMRDKNNASAHAPLPLKVNLRMPQVSSVSDMQLFAESLDRGLQSQSESTQKSSLPIIHIGVDLVDGTGDSLPQFCDDFKFPKQSRPKQLINDETMNWPEIIILIGCGNNSIPNQKLSLVEIDQDSGTVLVRTVFTVDQKDELLSHLETEVSSTLHAIYLVPLTQQNDNHNKKKVESISIELIVEDPSSHSTQGGGISTKDHFDMIGKALASSVQSTVRRPLLEDLALISKGQNSEIGLDAYSTAYLSLPEDIITTDKSEEYEGKDAIKHVSSEDLARWMHSHTTQRTTGNHGHVKWTLFVPSSSHTPLTITSTSGQGGSIILSPPGGESKSPNGLSLVNLPSDAEMTLMYASYNEAISQSLGYLVGYIRAIHGLEPSPPAIHNHSTTSSFVKYTQNDRRKLSFWELESLARSYYSTSLEHVFSEMDTIHAVLSQHGSTLALPKEVAHKLNNATDLIRRSIALKEGGYPAIYICSLLHDSLRQLDSVQSHHQFMELPYFAPDHYLAVFSPLVLPLLLPMILGLVREVKRFRELRSKVA